MNFYKDIKMKKIIVTAAYLKLENSLSTIGVRSFGGWDSTYSSSSPEVRTRPIQLK